MSAPIQLLRAAGAAYALGAAWVSWGGTSLGSHLFMDRGWPHADALALERGIACLLLGAGLALLFRFPAKPAAILIAAYAVIQAWATADQGGTPFAGWSYAAHALRLAVPLALFGLWTARDPSAGESPGRGPAAASPSTLRGVAWILAVGASLTFATHGLEAWHGHPRFIDYVLTATRLLPGPPWEESSAGILLKAVACADFAAAGLVLFLPRPWVAAWMGGWGLATAGVRPLEMGFGSLPEFLIRAPHFLAPAALFVIWRSRAAARNDTTGSGALRSVPRGRYAPGRGVRHYRP